MAVICTLPAQRARGLDPVVKTHTLQITAVNKEKHSPVCLQTFPCALSHTYYSHMLTNIGCRALTESSFAELWLSGEDTQTFPPKAALQGWRPSNPCAVAKGESNAAAISLQKIQLRAEGAEVLSPSSSSILVVEQALFPIALCWLKAST